MNSQKPTKYTPSDGDRILKYFMYYVHTAGMYK